MVPLSTDQKRLSEFLYLLRSTHPLMEKIYTQGGCYQLFAMIKAVFPEARCFYDQKRDHVYTELGERFFDITGEERGLVTQHLRPIEDFHYHAPQWHFDSFWVPVIRRQRDQDLVPRVLDLGEREIVTDDNLTVHIPEKKTPEVSAQNHNQSQDV